MDNARAPWKRSASIPRRSRSSGGLRRGPPRTVTDASRRSGSSLASSPSIQPSWSTGSPTRPLQRVQPPIQRAAVDLANGRFEHDPARQGVDDERAYGHAQEVGEDPIVVVGDRKAPAVAAHERAQVAAVTADGHGGDLHVRVGGPRALEDVELARA